MNKSLLQAPCVLYHGANPTPLPAVGSLNILGIGFDGTACFRRGASNGPDAIREISEDLESYSPYLDLDLSEIPHFYDVGNLVFDRNDDKNEECQSIHTAFNTLFAPVDLTNGKTSILTMGGDHSISYPAIVKYLDTFPDLILLHLDAHADLRDGYDGHHFSHASIIKRSLDHFGPGHRLAQYGIRSGTREEFTWMRKADTLFHTLQDFSDWLQTLEPAQPIYLTLDLDFFDPALLPGTGTPEAGGETFHTFITILTILAAKNVVGADVVELAPNIDPTGNSAIFAAKVVRELILCMQQRRIND